MTTIEQVELPEDQSGAPAVDSAVKSADADNATVLLFVEQTFTSAARKQASSDRIAAAPPDITAMAITLRKAAGRWLASDVVAGQQQR